jgi:hypothetical protein
MESGSTPQAAIEAGWERRVCLWAPGLEPPSDAEVLLWLEHLSLLEMSKRLYEGGVKRMVRTNSSVKLNDSFILATGIQSEICQGRTTASAQDYILPYLHLDTAEPAPQGIARSPAGQCPPNSGTQGVWHRRREVD